MGSKGSQTQQQSGVSTYTANPLTQAYGAQALGMAGNAAQSPFQLPVAPVAGFTDLQNQAFQQTQQQQGMAQPYYNQAQGLFNQSAAPITSQQINQYMDPFAGQVMANLAEQQGQQMNDLTGKATQAAGGVGADRIGVAQGELGRQQALAQGQTLSGIYGQALSAAQQDAQRQQAAAYGIGNLGGAAQNAAMQGTSALYGMGSQQQQLNQAQLNAPYQNQLAQIAFPYQNAQYLAGITGGLAGAMGGTTTSNQYGTMTPAQPSIFSQVAGLGTGLAGAAGAFNSLGFGGNSAAYGGGNAFSGDAYGGSSANPLAGLSAGDYGAGFAMGGPVGFAPGGDTSTDQGEPAWMKADPTIPVLGVHSQVNQPKVQPLNMSAPAASNTGSDIGKIIGTVAQVAPFLMASAGGAVGTTPYQAYADGGDTDTPPDFGDRFADASTMGDMSRAQALSFLARRNNPQAFAPPPPPPVNQDVVNPGKGNEFRLSGTDAVRPALNPNGTSTEAGAPTTIAAETPRATTGLAAISPAAAQLAEENRRQMQAQTFDVPYPGAGARGNTSRDFARSPWLALMNAGFGMMAGTSPFAGVNIGKGLLAGTQTLENQRKEDRSDEEINQRAKQLAMTADQHLRQYTQLTPAEMVKAEQNAQTLEQNKWQIVYDPQSGKSYWTKAGEEPVPATPGSAPPGSAGAPVAGTNPAVSTAPAAGNQAPATPTDFSYKPPSPDPAHGPGPIFNPKTGVPTAENAMTTRTDMIEARKRSNAAANQDLQIGQVKNAFSMIDQAGSSWFQTGAFAQQKIDAAKALNSILVAGGFDPISPDIVGNAEELGKLTTRLGFALSATLGSREAQQIVKQAIEANPGINNTPAGRKYILASMDAAIAREKEGAQFTTDYYRRWHTTIGAETEFNRLNPPEKYVTQAAIASAPPQFQKPEELNAAVKFLREHPNDPKVVGKFNQIYHGTAAYFLKGITP